jgi:hypothetical protein
VPVCPVNSRILKICHFVKRKVRGLVARTRATMYNKIKPGRCFDTKYRIRVLLTAAIYLYENIVGNIDNA